MLTSHRFDSRADYTAAAGNARDRRDFHFPVLHLKVNCVQSRFLQARSD
jgi:hypothetical protein